MCAWELHSRLQFSLSLATFAVDRLKIYLLQISHICALFRLHLEGETIQQPVKSHLASLG